MAERIEKSHTVNRQLRKLVHMHRMDLEYLKLEESNFEGIVQHFVEVCRLCLADKEGAQAFLEAWLHLALRLDGEHLVLLHAMLVVALENVHKALVESRGRTNPLHAEFATSIFLGMALGNGRDILLGYYKLVGVDGALKIDTTSNIVPPNEVVAENEQYQIVE